ncbi:hypothetical protein C9374_010836 [Naegleria lovaniensis]|uniref:Calcineurin-like phosphoesterase domain-containing protein n=1 Tax=Naegleria lovaniensis TaxID=51637 RepID=A0AA88GHK9_NAELO|nr:uncharacterized protein C9374_010836 [Naegleria lovaniensis]KAG2374266.1 hypothetical protein C9374_010836 [Naegleria lovaniensis]
MSAEFLLLLNDLTAFYSKIILRNDYALTYLDNNYHSLVFVGGILFVIWTFLVVIPIYGVIWLLDVRNCYRLIRKDDYSQQPNLSNLEEEETLDEEEYSTSNHHIHRLELRRKLYQSQNQGLCRKFFNGCASLALFVACVLITYMLVMNSTFSRVHYLWVGVIATGFFMAWILSVHVVDWKWILVLMYFRLFKNEDLSNFSALSTRVELNDTDAQQDETLLRSSTQDDTMNVRPTLKKRNSLGKSKLVLLCLDIVSPRVAARPKMTTVIVIACVAIFFLISTLVSYFCYHICIAYDPVEVSTLFSRTVLSKRTCEYDEICYTYLTVPEKMSSEMIVNFQVSTSHFYKGFVELGKFDPEEELNIASSVTFDKNKQASCFLMENIFEESRYQCYAELTELESGSSYIVRAGYSQFQNDDSGVHYGSIVKFRTTPSEEDDDALENIAFINGGDLAWRNPTIALGKYINMIGYSQKSIAPYFAIVGGDVSYDNGCAACYRRWDDWFHYWAQYMTTTIQYGSTNHTYALPIITAVGNHESGNFLRPRSDDAFYIRYFPMSISGESERVAKDPQMTRKLQHVHYLSSHTMIVVLDSWVHDSPQDQIEYITKVFENTPANKYRNRIVVIHHPMYTSAKYKSFIAKEMIEKWESLFLKMNVTSVFENHVHTYKQTYPLKDGKIVTKKSSDSSTESFTYTKVPEQYNQHGIIYVGDGSWGVTFWNVQMDVKNPIFRQIGAFSHVYHVNTRLLNSGTTALELSALGYNNTCGAIYHVEGSKLRILTV